MNVCLHDVKQTIRSEHRLKMGLSVFFKFAKSRAKIARISGAAISKPLETLTSFPAHPAASRDV